MPKVRGPRLPSPGSDATGTPAHPKYPPLTVTDCVKFKPPGASRSVLGSVLTPDGGDVRAEIDGDTVRVQADQGGRVYEVRRSDVKPMHGKALALAKEKQEKRRRPLRQKRAKPQGAPYLRALVDGPPSPIADRGAPAPFLLVHCGPAQLHPVPKEIPPVRSDAYREFVREFICISCALESRPVEAHHEGAHPFGVKCDDLLCVPLCAGPDGCHKFYTDHNHLPDRTREESLCLMEPPQSPPGARPSPRPPISEQERTRTPENYPPQPDELLLLVSRRLYGMSLREVCGDLWPSLRWKPLLSGDDSASEHIRGSGKTAAQLVHAQMMTLAQRGSLSLRLSEHEEIEAQAAIVYEARRQAEGGGRHA